MLKKLTINIDDEPREITVGSARKEDGIRRSELMLEAVKMEGSEPRKQVAFYLYPTCVAAVREPEDVKHMSFDDFVSKVDEVDIDAWAASAYKCNPQWRTSLEALAKVGEQEAEKKSSIPSSGSEPSTETEKATETSQPSTS